jgi:acetyl esterase
MTWVHPQVEKLLQQWAGRPATPVGQLTAAAVRADDLAILDLQSAPTPLCAVEDLELPGTAGLNARIYRPRRGPLPTIVYLHGGGFVIAADGYHRPLRELALATGCLVAALNVRLAPEHPFPTPVNDAVLGTRSLAAIVAQLGGTRPLGVAGDSSGGNLAAVVARELTREGLQLDFQVLIYPMLDATANSPSYHEFARGFGFSREKSLWYFDQYLPAGLDRRDPRASPLFERDLAGLPPTLVITAECDPLRDEGERYARRLQQAGCEVTLRRYDGMIHGFFQMTAAIDAARQLQLDIAEWLTTRIGIAGSATATSS